MNLVQYIVHNLEIANRWILNHAIVACVSNVAWVASNFLMSGWPNSVSLHTRTRRSFGGHGPNLQCLNLLGEGTMRVVSTEEGHCGWHKVPRGHAIKHISANVRNGQFHAWSSGFLQKSKGTKCRRNTKTPQRWCYPVKAACHVAVYWKVS